jgi:NADH:ubiquinone reductase (H+-translocating)
MKIVIIGGGFAGVNLSLDLARNEHYEVTLVDKNNYNFFPPLIYQVATAFLEPSSISFPFRKLFRGKKNLHFRLGELLEVLPEKNIVLLSNGEVKYDYLVFATGAETNFFGMENVKANAIAMKTLDDAIEMRNKMLQLMEQATISTDPSDIKKRLTVVIAGGGPTGVEVSGVFAEMRNGILRKEYPELAGKGSEIYLIDGGDSLLSPMSPQSQKSTFEDLRRMGVKIKLNTHVKDFVNDTVVLSGGETIEAKTLIWAAGVTAKTFPGIPQESYGRGRRMLVNEFNLVNHTKNIFAIGDTCIQLTDSDFPSGHPQVAQVAIQQGKNLASNFKLMARHLPMRGFRYKDKGSMAIIGKNKAVVDLPKPKLHFNGFIAWCAWLFIHLVSLITYRNRVRTLYNWMIAYFTNDQSLRMIIKPTSRQILEEEKV